MPTSTSQANLVPFVRRPHELRGAPNNLASNLLHLLAGKACKHCKQQIPVAQKFVRSCLEASPNHEFVSGTHSDLGLCNWVVRTQGAVVAAGNSRVNVCSFTWTCGSASFDPQIHINCLSFLSRNVRQLRKTGLSSLCLYVSSTLLCPTSQPQLHFLVYTAWNFKRALICVFEHFLLKRADFPQTSMFLGNEQIFNFQGLQGKL